MNYLLYFFKIFCFVLLFFMFFPVYIDLSNFSPVIEKNAFDYLVSFPVPLGFFTFSIFVFLSFFLSFFYPDKFFKVFSFSFFCGSSFLLFCFFAFYIFLGHSVVRLIQIFLPCFIFSCFSFPLSSHVRCKVLDCVFWGAGWFFFLHLISIVSSDAFSFLNSRSYSDRSFPMFFGYSIYQSLVVYPAVVSLFMLLSLYRFFIGDRKSILVFFVCYSLLLLAARRVSLVEIFFIFIIFLIFVVNCRVMKLRIFPFFLFSLLYCFTAFLYSPLLHRFLYKVEQLSTRGGERVEIYTKALNNIPTDNFVFSFGDAGDEVISHHSFLFDVFYRTGFVGFILYFFTIFYFVFLFLKRGVRPNNKIFNYFFLILFIQVFVQNMVNSSLTQPYYLMALFFVFYSLLFYPLGQYNETNSSRYV